MRCVIQRVTEASVTVAGELRQPLIDQRIGLNCQCLVLLLCGLIDLGNGSTGQDIMELVEQNGIAPEPIQFFSGVGICQDAQQLQIHHQQFALPVAALVAAMEV